MEVCREEVHRVEVCTLDGREEVCRVDVCRVDVCTVEWMSVE